MADQVAPVVEEEVKPEATDETKAEGTEAKASDADEATDKDDGKVPENHDFRRMTKFIREAAAQKQRADMLEQQISQLTSTQEQYSQASERPTRAQFADPADYADALAEWMDNKHTAEIQAIKSERETTPIRNQFAKSIEAVKTTHTDYDEVMSDAQSMPVTPQLASAILESPAGAELQYYLAKNKTEYESLLRMPERQMLMKIGQLSATLTTAEKKPAPVSGAPEPIKPLATRSGGPAKDPEKMTMAEWARWDDEHGVTARRRLKYSPRK